MKIKFTPKIMTIILFTVIIVGIPIATLIEPKKTRSETENRTLASFPKLTDSSGSVDFSFITSRDNNYMNAVEEYFSDHIAFRDAWVANANKTDRLLGRQLINGIYTHDDRMIQVFDAYEEENVSESVEAINYFAAKYPKIPMYFMLAPTSQEIYGLPKFIERTDESKFINETCEKLENVSSINCISALSAHSDEYIYYRTDHHWTSLGAYYAYVCVGEFLGYEPYDLSEFDIEAASRDFRGTLFSKTLDSSVTPDTIEYYHLRSNEPEIKMSIRNNGSITVHDSLYFREFLECKDKYSSFTGQNAPAVTIETGIKNGKSLLIIKDSYAHCLVPFLSKHYERITMLDLRYISSNINGYARVKDYSQVLFVFNVISFSEDNSLMKLRL